MSTRLTFIIGIAVILVAIVLILISTYKVREDQQAILLQLGEPINVVNQWGTDEPGLRFKTPFVQNVEYFEKRVLGLQRAGRGDDPGRPEAAGGRRLHPLPHHRSAEVLPVRRQRGNSPRETRRNPQRQHAAGLGTVELITVLSGERAQLMTEIRDQVNRQSTGFGVDVIDVRIRRADLPEENSQAVYQRMQTEREREAKEFRAQGEEESQRIRSRADRERVVLLAEAERESQTLRGEGDEEALRISRDAYGRDPEFYAFYRAMQAYREASATRTRAWCCHRTASSSASSTILRRAMHRLRRRPSEERRPHGQPAPPLPALPMPSPPFPMYSRPLSAYRAISATNSRFSASEYARSVSVRPASL